MNTTDITRITIASAISFGRIDCNRPCSGHAMAMMKRAQATGAITVRATLTAEKDREDRDHPTPSCEPNNPSSCGSQIGAINSPTVAL